GVRAAPSPPPPPPLPRGSGLSPQRFPPARPEDARAEGLASLEAALAGLAPSPPALNRDRLLFRAGQESVPRRARRWQWATGLLAVTAACLGVALVCRPEPPTVVQVVIKDRALPQPPAPDPETVPVRQPDPPAPAGGAREGAGVEAARLRREMLRWGVDGRPSGPAAGASGQEPAGKGPVQPPAVSTYHQLRTSLQTGGEL